MSLNLCQFIGHLGADPEVKYLQDGTAVTNINIACSERWKDKQTGEQKERTEWVRASSFGKQAEVIGQYFKKGSQIYISGQMQTRKYQAADGTDRYSTDIRIGQFQFLDKKDDSQQQNQSNSQQSQQSPSAQQSQSAQNRAKTLDDFDDIPF